MNREMNVVKGLAIIAMVIGHCKSTLVSNVYLYHMALFVFVSGYFYNDVYSSEPVKLIKKRLKSLYVPFLKFNIIVLLLKVILLDNIILKDGGVMDAFFVGIKSMIRFNSVDGLISAFWFLKNLLYINIIFCVISFIVFKLVKKHRELARGTVIFTLFLLFFYVASKGKLINGEVSYITRAFILNIMFYLGFLYHKYEDSKVKVLFNKPWLFLIAVAYIFFAGRYAYIDTFYFDFENIYFFMASSLVGIYLNIYLAKFINKYGKVNALIAYAGTYSLWVLAYHFFAFKIAIFIKVMVFDLSMSLIKSFPTYVHLRYDWILDATLGVVVPLLMCYVFKKMMESVENQKSIEGY